VSADHTPGSARKSALFVDLYELTMAASYLAEGLDQHPATFQLFTRRLPPRWGYLVAAGLDEALAILAEWSFSDDDLAHLESLNLFEPAFLARLGSLRFRGEVRALPEGTVVFPDEPLVEVRAPLLEAQLIETVLLNIVHLDSLLAGKASRCVTAARGRRLVEFGARRAHGGEAALRASRSSYLAGFDATSDVLAGRCYGIPVAGTMAHSYVESFPSEEDAFAAFVRAFPHATTLLIDTYDTLEGARRAAALASRLGEAGSIAAVRLDSGDLGVLAREVREILDASGAPQVGIFASGGLDEDDIARSRPPTAPCSTWPTSWSSSTGARC
jgi:nicotinate phosphoribosyltransferase